MDLGGQQKPYGQRGRVGSAAILPGEHTVWSLVPDFLDGLEDGVKVALAVQHVAPGGAHAESGGAGLLSLCRTDPEELKDGLSQLVVQ